jgi:hypothetical protein
MGYIIRADFYPNGEVVPLGLTDNHGNSLYVQKAKRIKHGSDEYSYFECLADGKRFLLTFKGVEWGVEHIK